MSGSMKKNKNTSIIGRNVILVPYRRKHVPQYHEWMKSSELQLLTASEPLSLDEEYEMQRSWLVDEDKCTFIVLEKSKFNSTEDEIDAMIGDTNLFFNQCEDSTRLAEAEIMIAKKSARGKRHGWEAMLLMLRYGCEELAVEKFQAKIKLDNVKSLSMFQKMGFERVSESSVFKEVTLEKYVSENWKLWLTEETKGLECVQIGEE